jgi:hypothetical protein
VTPPDSLVSPALIEAACAIAAACPPGCFVEFGVYKGGSAWHFARVAEVQGRELYLYDTFRGMPFQGPWDSHPVGDFRDTSLDAVQQAIPSARCVPGVFPESLVPMPPVAFVHVDADQYESIAAAIRVFPPLMVSGGAMVFDDYPVLDSAVRAITEWNQPLTFIEGGRAVWRKP